MVPLEEKAFPAVQIAQYSSASSEAAELCLEVFSVALNIFSKKFLQNRN